MFSNKKKFLICVFVISFLSGGIIFINYYCDPDNVGKRMAKEIIRAVESGDKNQVKELFSEEIIADVDDLDEGIDDFIELYDGELISLDNEAYYMENVSAYKKVGCSFIVTTTKNTYYMRFSKYLSGKSNIKGYSSIGLSTIDDFDKDKAVISDGIEGIYAYSSEESRDNIYKKAEDLELISESDGVILFENCCYVDDFEVTDSEVKITCIVEVTNTNDESKNIKIYANTDGNNYIKEDCIEGNNGEIITIQPNTNTDSLCIEFIAEYTGEEITNEWKCPYLWITTE